jgi:hypothetical protein
MTSENVFDLSFQIFVVFSSLTFCTFWTRIIFLRFHFHLYTIPSCEEKRNYYSNRQILFNIWKCLKMTLHIFIFFLFRNLVS